MAHILTDPGNVRIITTLGHVDHGKTTLMDALLAANNIISHRMAGKMKYMDSREDEQERGITMEASAVSLKFTVNEATSSNGGRSARNFVINMIDTPGHVDFSSEVSTASRLCDGALVLVDVVEGVCTQTIAVLRQSWKDRLRPILVINKFDRLITELKLSPTEAHHHLSRLIEQVNAVMGSFFAGERMQDDLRWREERERRLAEKKERLADEAEATLHDSDDYQEKDDEDIYFSPEKGNVVFASALDGWGFRLGKFAQLYASKLGIKEVNLRRVLWGDFYLDPKTKRVIGYKHLKGRALKPLFVQFVLDNIWAVYDSVLLHPDSERITKIVSTLNLKIPPRDLKSKDAQQLLSAIFSQWLSLSTAIIQAVIDIVPPPTVAQATRIPNIIYPDLYEETVEPRNKLEGDLFSSNSAPDACVSGYVSKMFAVAQKDLPENKKKVLTADEMRAKAQAARLAKQGGQEQAGDTASAGIEYRPPTNLDDQAPPPLPEEETEVLLGFTRLYAGTLSVGKQAFAILPKYDDALGPTSPRNSRYLIKVTIEALYVMMGRELVAVESVRAGNICAIKGLSGKVLRNATLCAPNSEGIAGGDVEGGFLINMGRVQGLVRPIVRVALEPVKPSDMAKLITGMKLLSQADPCAETFQQPTGEHVILTAGELHLERCLKDLRERFAKVDIQASKPIVPFRETAVKAADMAPTKTPNAPRGTIQGSSSNNLISFSIRAMPLPSPILEFLLDNASVVRSLERGSLAQQPSEEPGSEIDSVDVDIREGDDVRNPTVKPEQFWDALGVKLAEVGGEWSNMIERIWSFGPQNGGCLLIDSRKDGESRSSSVRKKMLKLGVVDNDAREGDKLLRDLENHIETGFQLAVSQGPLCAEPVQGLAYLVEKVTIDRDRMEQEIEQNRVVQVTGSLISSVRDSCRNGLLDWSPRLMLAMYSCDIQCSTEVLGKVYGVVARRRGRIVAEEMKEGTSFFTVSALLPVVESFGFADDIRKRTSGAASPQLIFKGYELLDQDPFWVPTTEEELEDLGEKADRSNIAKSYMDGVRERKGMFVDRKIVEFAEKQRTLKR